MLHGYLQVGEVGKGEIQAEWRRWIQREKSPSRSSPDVHRAVDLRKPRLRPCVCTSKASANAAIATGMLRPGRLIADHGGLYSTAKLRQIEAKGG
jgi:hypothetical protein